MTQDEINSQWNKVAPGVYKNRLNHFRARLEPGSTWKWQVESDLGRVIENGFTSLKAAKAAFSDQPVSRLQREFGEVEHSGDEEREIAILRKLGATNIEVDDRPYERTYTSDDYDDDDAAESVRISFDFKGGSEAYEKAAASHYERLHTEEVEREYGRSAPASTPWSHYRRRF